LDAQGAFIEKEGLFFTVDNKIDEICALSKYTSYV
jgi:hypothetical protein